MLKTAELTMPIDARFITQRVICGKLKESRVRLNACPPKMSGNHPKAKIRSAFVAHEWNPSVMLKPQYHFQPSGIFLFVRRPFDLPGWPMNIYAIFSAPQPQRRCCL